METKEAIERHAAECERGRAEWGPGPWQTEPDRLEFKHAGLQCLLSRNSHMGNWCAYVGVPKGHPAHGKDYNDDAISGIEIHGGLTYSEHCFANICHVTEGEDDLYWFGFDCAHVGDFVPGLERAFRKYSPDIFRGAYRDVPYVVEQTKALADQLMALSEKDN